MKKNGFMAAFMSALALLGHTGRETGTLRNRRNKTTAHRHMSVRGRSGAPGSKLGHRLASGHSRSAGWTDRKTRKYARRGYGYVAPFPRKKWVEGDYALPGKSA